MSSSGTPDDHLPTELKSPPYAPSVKLLQINGVKARVVPSMSASGHQMARGIHSARAPASVRPRAGPGPRGNVFPCLLIQSALQRFYTLESSSIEKHVKQHTAQLCSSCPVPPGDTSAAFPLVCRVSEPSCTFVLTGTRCRECFASILKPAILLK